MNCFKLKQWLTKKTHETFSNRITLNLITLTVDKPDLNLEISDLRAKKCNKNAIYSLLAVAVVLIGRVVAHTQGLKSSLVIIQILFFDFVLVTVWLGLTRTRYQKTAAWFV